MRERDACLCRRERGGGGLCEGLERGRGRRHRESGGGLGLSLVKRLMELHGGYVDLQSEPGSGTKVVCHVPVRTEPETLESAAEEAPGKPVRPWEENRKTHRSSP